MWRSGGLKSDPVAPRSVSRLRARLLLGITLAIVFLIVVFLFPVIFELRIDVPSQVQFGSPSSVMFEIANQNLTPLTNVEYTCEVSTLITANAGPVRATPVLSRGRFPRIASRQGVRGQCQTGYLVTAPVKTVEYRLTVTYRASPWPQLRTRIARIAAQLNGKGEVTGWKVN